MSERSYHAKMDAVNKEIVETSKTHQSPNWSEDCCREFKVIMKEQVTQWYAGRVASNLKGNERERNVLFNDALNTFYLRLYGVRHMVKDHSDSEKGNPLPPHRLLLSMNSKGSFICTIPQTG